MTFSEYLEATGRTQASLAEEVGVSRQRVCQWVNTDARPAPSMVAKIERATGGMVSRMDLYPEMFAA